MGSPAKTNLGNPCSAKTNLGNPCSAKTNLGRDVSAQLSLPPEALLAAPPELSLTAAPGLTWVAQQGWQLPSAQLQLACARGPAAAWIPELHTTVLDGANAMARRALAASQLNAEATQRRPDGYAQSFHASDAQDNTTVGQHLLGFSPAPHAAVWLCTATCTGSQDPCASLVTSLTLHGTSAQPPVNAASRGVMLLSAHPQLAAAALAGVMLVGCGWFLARRPRPRR